MTSNATSPPALIRARSGLGNVVPIQKIDSQTSRASPYRVQAVPGCRIYRVRPARRSDGNWTGPDTFTHYVMIIRISDGKKCATWKHKDWSDTDSWAHRQWEAWRKAG